MEVQGKMKGHGCFFKSQDSSRFGGRPRIFATCVEMILQAGNHNLEGYLCDISKEILLTLGLEILLMLGLEILLEIFTTVTQGQNCSPPPQCRLFSAHQQTGRPNVARQPWPRYPSGSNTWVPCPSSRSSCLACSCASPTTGRRPCCPPAWTHPSRGCSTWWTWGSTQDPEAVWEGTPRGKLSSPPLTCACTGNHPDQPCFAPFSFWLWASSGKRQRRPGGRRTAARHPLGLKGRGVLVSLLEQGGWGRCWGGRGRRWGCWGRRGGRGRGRLQGGGGHYRRTETEGCLCHSWWELTEDARQLPRWWLKLL